MTISMTPAAIAVNRFGLGARPDEAPPADGKQWLLAQFSRYQPVPPAWANQPGTAALVAEYVKNRQEMRGANEEDKKSEKRMLSREIRDSYQSAVSARAESALTTPAPFIERLVHFWANHFAISMEKPAVAEFAGAFELEAIRPHVLGNFHDLLLAVEKHPAMLLYLDQANSIGPQSLAATRMAQRDPQKKRGLNENLAREIMELHTLGVRSGYTQADVTEFARAMTGWSIAGIGNDRNSQPEANGFAFRPALHESGSRTIMGRVYSQPGKSQAEAVLRDLANAQSTATHIATKLARHFVGDTPPQKLVENLANVFLNERGNLASVYRALIAAREAWEPQPAKFKSPWEWLISSLRGLGRKNLNGLNIAPVMNQLGQPVWRPGSPAGYDDMAESWAAPNALLRRVELAQRLANPFGDKIDARVLAEKLLMGTESTQTQTAIARAESASTGLALLLVSPEFLRR